MKVPYLKTHKSLSEQLEILQSRGLDCGLPNEGKQILHDFSYYTLSAYWYPFRRLLEANQTRETQWQYRASNFLQGAKLSDAAEIAMFDRKLRQVLFEGLAQLELMLRFQLTYVLGARSPFAHVTREHLNERACGALPPRKLRGKFEDSLDHWLDVYDQQIDRSKSEDFINHFLTKYDSEVPIWMAVEVLDFGSLGRLFNLLKSADQSIISKRFGVSNGHMFHGILYGLGILRNHVAHHNRVWNRRLSAKLKHLPDGVVEEPLRHLSQIEDNDRNKLYPWTAVLAYMLKTYDPTTNWHRTLATQYRKFPKVSIINGYHEMAAPSDWANLQLWTSKPDKEPIITIP